MQFTQSTEVYDKTRMNDGVKNMLPRKNYYLRGYQTKSIPINKKVGVEPVITRRSNLVIPDPRIKSVLDHFTRVDNDEDTDRDRI
ncbi:hypothetical protein V6B33_09775 [Mangrovibacillus sp. Mu-81]|jgi:hypothetical protein|uniref:hypothetical protein n=1 Tax=Mangrovibacillus sp. Mu-81 TaxID=3121478 RepID=UPI002FE43491